jgi:hypothetical protein
MEIKELLERHREYYLNHFGQALTKEKEKPGAAELLIELNKQGDEPNEVYRMYRFDFMRKENGAPKPVEFNLDGHLIHETVEYDIGEQKILVNPLVWNGTELILDIELKDWTDYEDWARKWLDLNDENEIDQNGYSGVIHNISPPEPIQQGTGVSIDLGTAPVDALTELIEIFLNTEGVRTIRIETANIREEKNKTAHNNK